MATHSRILAWRTHEESLALQYTKSHCGGQEGHLAFSIISYCITELLLKVSMLASGNLRSSGETEAMRKRGRDFVDGISTLFHLLYGCSIPESCLSRQIKKKVRVDLGGGEAGLIREDPRLHQPLALNVFPVAPLTYR